MKEHVFKITVKTNAARKHALNALFLAFAARQPDGCEFHIQSKPAPEFDRWQPIESAPRDREIIVKAKGFPWIATWSVRFNAWRTAEGRIIEGVTHWTETPKP